MGLKLKSYQEQGTKTGLFVIEASHEAELEELLKRLVNGEALRPLTAGAPAARHADPAAQVASNGKAAAEAPPAKPKEKKAETPPEPRKARAAPAAVANDDGDDDEEEEPSKAAEDSSGDDDELDEIPEAVAGAKKMRELLSALQAAGVDTKKKMIAWCTRNQGRVELLKTMAGVADRVERAASLLMVE